MNNFIQTDDAGMDAPDMSNPDVALDMYQSQVQMLANVLEDAHTLVERTSNRLRAVHKRAEELGDKKLAQRALDVYESVTALHHLIQHQDAARRGAEAVIEAVTEQRDEVLSEMDDLLSAIGHGNERHPKLEYFACEIRQDEAEYQEQQAVEYVYEMLAEDSQQYIAEALITSGISKRRAYYYADCLYDSLNGGRKMSDEQMDLLKQLVSHFTLSEHILRAEAAGNE